MAVGLELVADVVEQTGMVHLPGGEAEVAAGLGVSAVVRLEPGGPLAGGVSDEQARQPGNPDIHVVSPFLSVAWSTATERNRTIVSVRGWHQRLLALERTGSGVGLRQLPANASTPSLKPSAVINPRSSTPNGILFCG